MHAVVIGGGIVGLASAYYLGREGVDVTVLEQGRIGHGSTPRAGGGIREQFSTEVSIALSKESIAVWETFEEEFDADIGYRRNGYLYLARTAETADALRDAVGFHDDHGVPSRFVEPDAFSEHCPGVRADRYAGATYCPTDGYADTERALQGFALAAAREGVRIHLGRPATDVHREGDRVTGVDTAAGRLEADVVVNAAGAWSGKVARLAGVELHVRPERRQLAVVEPETAVPADGPFVTDLDSGSYFRPADGLAYVGGHFSESSSADPDAFRREADDSWTETALSNAREVATYFGPGSQVRRGWAGLYAMTPDHHPIVDEVVPGFVVASGFSGHGFMQAPATGQAVAELVTEGEASLVDVSGLTDDRFERDEGFEETFYSA